MNLNVEQRRLLQQALNCAYPSHRDLTLLVANGLGENLDLIVEADTLEEVTSDLIGWAIEKGRIAELIQASLDNNRDNPELRAFAGDRGIIAPLDPQLPPQPQAATTRNGIRGWVPASLKQERTSPRRRIWLPWGDYPPYVIISTVAAVITIVVALSALIATTPGSVRTGSITVDGPGSSVKTGSITVDGPGNEVETGSITVNGPGSKVETGSIDITGEGNKATTGKVIVEGEGNSVGVGNLPFPVPTRLLGTPSPTEEYSP